MARPIIRVWASSLEQCTLRLFENRQSMDHFRLIEMDQQEGGFFRCEIPQEIEEVCYDLQLPNGHCIPDPYADENTGGVHGRSVSYNRADDLNLTTRGDWKGVPIEEVVIMEIHVGSFTNEGTYQSLCGALDQLVESGITAIQLMPLLLTPGDRNWGYDPVSFFTLNPHYGSQDDLKALIDTAHKKGIAVVLDVVFNHLGPEGNYFSFISNEIFQRQQRTPWGDAINLSGVGSDVVRSIILQSIEKWMSDFGFDGIRVDAGEYLRPDDDSEFLALIAKTARSHCWHKHPILVLEHDLGQLRDNDYDTLFSEQGYNLLWNHAFPIEEQKPCGEGLNSQRSMTECLAHICASMESKQASRGAGGQFAHVNFLRSHDTIGNAGNNSRNDTLDVQAWLDALPLLLLNPSVPMVFMGDDWMADTPFHFFCDLKDTSQADLVTARRREFDNERLRYSKPMEEETFLKSKLDWTERETDEKNVIRHYFSRLAKIRQRYIASSLKQGVLKFKHSRSVSSGSEAVRWCSAPGEWFTLYCSKRQAEEAQMSGFGERLFFSDHYLDERDSRFSTSLYRSFEESDHG